MSCNKLWSPSPATMLVFLFVVLFAFVCQQTYADPFIPVGGGNLFTANEADLIDKRSFAWREASLLYVYVQFTNTSAPNNQSTYKAMFFPPVDRMSKLVIPGTFQRFVANGPTTDMWIWVSGFGMNSTAKQYTLGDYAVGSYTMTLTMEKGVVNSMTWIDGCSECNCVDTAGSSLSCPDSICITDNCAINKADCSAVSPDVCDLKIYLGWVGTDRRNRPSTSSGSLPFNFLQFGLAPVYRAAAGIENNFIFNISSL